MKKTIVIYFLFGLIFVFSVSLSCDFFYLASEEDYKEKNGIVGDDDDDDDNDNNDDVTLSYNNNLKTLNFTNGVLEPIFDSSETEYKLSVVNEIASIDLEAETENDTASIEIHVNSHLVTSEKFTLDIGYNTIIITVTAENEDKKKYTVTAHRDFIGMLKFPEQTTDSINIIWNPASSNEEVAKNLQYLVYYSENDDISNVEEIETNGILFEDDGTNKTTEVISGLKSNTTYYFNVLAVDNEDRKRHYTMASFRTKPVVVTIVANGVIQERNEGRGEFVIQRNHTAGDLVVPYSVAGAADQDDYESETALTGSVIIPDGEGTTSLFITAVNDIFPESDETINIALQEKTDYVLGSEKSAAIIIKDNPLIARWNFNNQINDQSGHDNTLFIYNDTDFQESGEYDVEGSHYLDFKGDNPYAECSGIKFSEQFTIVFYYKISEIIDNDYRTILCNRWEDGGQYFGFEVIMNIKFSDKSLNHFIDFLTFNGEETAVATSSNLEISTNEWYHMALAVDNKGKTCQFFQNGDNKTNPNTSGIVHDLPDSFALRLGTNFKNQYFFKDSLDDVQIFNNIKTQAEINEIINQEIILQLLEPTWSESREDRWQFGLSLDLDNKILGTDIKKYRIKWSNGFWSRWYYPGIDDINWNLGLDGEKCLVWAHFTTHYHKYYLAK